MIGRRPKYRTSWGVKDDKTNIGVGLVRDADLAAGMRYPAAYARLTRRRRVNGLTRRWTTRLPGNKPIYPAIYPETEIGTIFHAEECKTV